MTREDRKTIADLAESYKNAMHNYDSDITFARSVIKKFPYSYFAILRGRRFFSFWSNVVLKTSFLDATYDIKDITRLYYFINKLDKQICCATCGKPYTKKILPNATSTIFHCNTVCAQLDSSIKHKIQQTKVKNKTTTHDLLEKTKSRNRLLYGKDWFFLTDDFRAKTEKTWKDNGYDHPMRDVQVLQRMQLRYFEKHGVTCPFKDPEVLHLLKKKYKYNGRWFDSAPEIAYFIWLSDNNIEFTYLPNIVIEYLYQDKVHFYMPDFLVGDQLIELKGDLFFKADGTMLNPYDHSLDDLYEAKHQCMIANDVKILRTSDYTMYVSYVAEHYGKIFLKLLKLSSDNA